MDEKYEFIEFIRKLEDYRITIDPNHTEMLQLNKVIYKLRNIEAIISSIDVELLNADLFDNNFNNFKNYCNYFLSGQHNYLTSVQTTANNILNELLKYIDYNMLLGNRTGIRKNIRNYKYEITRQKNLIETETIDLLEEIKLKKANIDNEDSGIKKSFVEIDDKIKKLENRYDELNNSFDIMIKQKNEKIDDFIEKEKIKLDENYDKESIIYQKKFKEISDDYEKKYNNLENDYLSKYEELYKKIEEKDAQISKLLDIVGDKTRIGLYKKNADSSKFERIIWQLFTVLLFVGSFILMFYITLCDKNYDKFTIIKYIVSALLMGAATYTGRQASNSRKDEVYYRKQELELSSIDVYLENMDLNSKDEIKKELSLKLFGQAQNTYTNKYEEKKGFTTEDIIKIIEVLKNKN